MSPAFSAGWRDLTHPLAAGMPAYPGDPAVAVRPCRTHARDGYQVTALELGTHSGTHLDAPRHFLVSGRSLDDYPVERFGGRGVVVDARGHGPGEAIGPEVLGPVAGRLRGAAVVLVCTGWDRHFGTDLYFRHPHLSPALAGALVAAGARLVGIDGPSPDPLDGDDFPAHRILLGSDVLIAENLRDLAPLAGLSVEAWLLPLRVAGGDGAPVRAVARPLGRRRRNPDPSPAVYSNG